MPYAKPPVSVSPETHPFDLPPLKLRPKHRRTRSATPAFSDERGPGAFTPLPNLPRRKSHAVFHFDEQDSDSEGTVTPPLEQPQHQQPQSPANALRLTVDTKNVPSNASLAAPPKETSSLPFPTRGSPIPSPQPPSPSSASLTRTPSTPIILSNGKPLKPSLKSSHSSPHVPALRMHFRAQSEPATPSSGAVTPKNVHFAGDDALRSVRVFNSSGKPVNVSRTTNPDETETETEYESSNPNAGETTGYPFPKVPSAPEEAGFEIDSKVSSPIPAHNPPTYANVHVESLVLPKGSPPILRGSIIVRNIAFAKEVAVRFTLDNWHTTSEVACKHVVSLPSLPPPFPHPHTEGDIAAGSTTWDRFSFVIRLEDFERKLHEKTMWMVVRYTSPGMGEWWDNNSGKNYCVGFKKPGTIGASSTSPVVANSQQRTFSAPSTLKGTPTTGAMQAVAHAAKQQAPGKITLPPAQVRSHRVSLPPRPSPPIRHHSSPQSPTLSSMSSGHSTAASLYASVPSKLSLMNYAAPVTSPSSNASTPRQGSPAMDTNSLASPNSADSSLLTPTSPPQMHLVGGMPATAPKYDLAWPPSNNSSTLSLSDTTPPPIYTALPTASELEKQRAKDIVSSPTSSLASDSTYAAFVKQWCFVQSPTPSPNLTPPGSGGSSVGSASSRPGGSWRGLGDAFSGLYGATGMRSDSPMLASM